MIKIRCKICEADIFEHAENSVCGFDLKVTGGIKSFTKSTDIKIPEEATRDKQAEGYLKHSKIASQSRFFRQFVSNVSVADDSKQGMHVLDLGCGPGPTVRILREEGYSNITAIDFSIKASLSLYEPTC